MSLSDKTEQTATRFEKLLAAGMYGAASLGIMFVNKHLLTKYHFPSFHFIALIQTFGSLIVLSFQRWGTKSIYFPPLSWAVFWEIQPLPLIFFCNMLSGLGATKSLNMPMFVLLRRFSIPMTMLLERMVLGKEHKPGIALSIVAMVMGALIAASGDLTIEFWGCLLILLNDVFTAANGVTIRWKQDKDKANLQQQQAVSPAMDMHAVVSMPTLLGKEDHIVSRFSPAAEVATPTAPYSSPVLTPSTASPATAIPSAAPVATVSGMGGATTALGVHGLLFYNSMFTFPVVLLWLVTSSKEVHGLMTYDMWRHPPFVLALVLTGFMGFALQYSTYICTKLNSPLTTTVVGCLKNFFTTFLGMLYSDYFFTVLSFSGAIISFLGSLWYSWIEFTHKQMKEKNRFV